MDDRPYVNEGLLCYHEAGHAVAFWHYGIRLLYVTMRPPAGSGHSGQTALADRAELSGLAEIEAEMRCAAAGQIAQTRVFVTHEVPTDEELVKSFTRNAAIATEYPLTPFYDEFGFAKMALARDEEIAKTAPDKAVGPVSWVSVWREAEQLIRFDLWPAVKAVGEELRRNPGELSHEEVDALATTALARRKHKYAIACPTIDEQGRRLQQAAGSARE